MKQEPGGKPRGSRIGPSVDQRSWTGRWPRGADAPTEGPLAEGPPEGRDAPPPPSLPPRNAASGRSGLGLITGLADDLLDGIESMRDRASEAFEPSLRLGVTGLSGAGKTVFITALVASLLERDRMRLLSAEAEGRIAGALLRPQPDADVPRFAFEAHRAALLGDPPSWPVSTRSISQLRLALRYRSSGFVGALKGAQTLNLDIVDYPGEWLIDLPLLEQDYETWAETALAAARSAARRSHAGPWEAMLASVEPGGAHNESTAEALAAAYRDYLWACRRGGLSALAPGRFLMPGDYEGSPALSFAPLPRPARTGSNTLWGQMRARFEAYKRMIVKPFFRNHFARLDRQVVLIDALSALAQGPRAFADLTDGMAETLACFRHGQNGWLDRIMGARRIDRLLFAATKADHLHHTQHARLLGIVEAMLAEATQRAAFAGAETKGLAIAAIRATAEQEIDRRDGTLRVVRGRREDGKEVAVYPGALPEDARALMATAAAAGPGSAPESWPDASYARVAFRPPRMGTGGPPHIRMDGALEFLIGDRLG
ncbi:MAG: YcjX family protein [Pseudomonadota bacterium]